MLVTDWANFSANLTIGALFAALFRWGGPTLKTFAAANFVISGVDSAVNLVHFVAEANLRGVATSLFWIVLGAWFAAWLILGLRARAAEGAANDARATLDRQPGQPGAGIP